MHGVHVHVYTHLRSHLGRGGVGVDAEDCEDVGVLPLEVLEVLADVLRQDEGVAWAPESERVEDFASGVVHILQTTNLSRPAIQTQFSIAARCKSQALPSEIKSTTEGRPSECVHIHSHSLGNASC